MQQAVWKAATICLRPLQVDLLTLKVVSESHVMWATSVSILLFLGFTLLCSRPRPDVCDRQTSDRRQRASSLNASALWGRGHNKSIRNGFTIPAHKNMLERNPGKREQNFSSHMWNFDMTSMPVSTVDAESLSEIAIHKKFGTLWQKSFKEIPELFAADL